MAEHDKALTHIVDARRLLCPMPVIRAQDKIKTLKAGETLIVICSDPGAKYDIPAWCRINGHKVLAIEEQEYELRITIIVGDAAR